ncbi:hypothetical protein [uncultured Victivallis sp.]|uniref:hypothetical protein n=1 Tax=uncultured Victivallis sp. TaxID=354118 RepID=UPI00258DCFF1|nr:hypothetical protein [uncultured Victivallis sp.]
MKNGRRDTCWRVARSVFGRAIFWCDAGEQGKTGKADAALLRFSVAVKVMAAATRLPPETKIRVAYF